MDEINLWSAIAEMRKLTAQGVPFTFEHYTWDESRQKASGLRQVDRATLSAATGSILHNYKLK